MSISRKRGTENFRSIPPKTVSIVRLDAVASGSSREIFIRKMGKSMVNAVVVRQRSAVFVTVNGMVTKIARRTRRQIDFWKQQNRLAGNVAIIAGQWLS
jgi:hypothetical protein